ncbi:hypothetical protein vseg_007785 [Gypsophila vaccaria]
MRFCNFFQGRIGCNNNKRRQFNIWLDAHISSSDSTPQNPNLGNVTNVFLLIPLLYITSESCMLYGTL